MNWTHETELSLEEAWETFRKQQEETWTQQFREEIYREYIDMACHPDGLEKLREEQRAVASRMPDRELFEKARAHFEQAYKSDGVRFIHPKRGEQEGDLVFEAAPLGSQGHESALKAEEFIMKAVDREIRVNAVDEVQSIRHTNGARTLLVGHAPLLVDRQDSEDEDSMDSETAIKASATQQRHLITAREVLDANPSISSLDGFVEACESRGAPGGSVRKRVQELGKDILDKVHLPDHYTGFSGGFQRLVEDLWHGTVRE